MKKNNNILTSTLNKVFNAKIFSNKIFHNQITLFVVSAIAFISLYRHIVMYEFSAVLLFFIIAGLAYSFTRNMTIVLGSAFLATLIVSMFKGLLGFKEGNENMVESSGNIVRPTTTATGTATTATTGTATTATPATTATTATTATGTPTGAPGATAAADITTIPGAASLPQSLLSGALAGPPLTAPTLGGSNKDNYQNQIPLTPGLYNMPNKEQMTKQLGKATEIEQSYDNLEKIMGSKNIQAMSSDTKDLIRQQNDLIKQLKSMTPALNEAMNALGGLDLSKLTNMFNKRDVEAE
jgi:hypothetical protein